MTLSSTLTCEPSFGSSLSPAVPCLGLRFHFDSAVGVEIRTLPPTDGGASSMTFPCYKFYVQIRCVC